MGAIRAGGIVSGVDTNTLIDQLVTAAKEPITALDNQYHKLELTKSLFQAINNDLSSMKNSMFQLRLESSFKSKLASVSNQSVAGVQVGVAAKEGNYLLEVLQTAKQSQASTRFGVPQLYTLGAGIQRISQITGGNIYQQLEGDYRTVVTSLSTSATATPPNTVKEVAVTEFTPNDSRSYKQQTTVDNIGTQLMDAEGNIDQTWLAANDNISIDFALDGGTTQSYSIDLSDLGYNIADIKDINDLNAILESHMNARINYELGTDDLQHVAVRADYDYQEGTWRTTFYNVSEGHEITVGVSAASTLSSELGFDSGTVSLTGNKVYKFHVADTLANLQTKLSSGNGGVIPGIQATFQSTGLEYGSFHMYYDSTVVTQKSKPTTIYGVTAGSAIDLDKLITDPASGFSSSAVDQLFGRKFTINNMEIDLSDYAGLSARALMGMVNSSGAGVTMSFDALTQSFQIKSNTPGAVNVTMGNTSDTSSFFQVFGLTADAGSYRIMGSTAGMLNLEAKMGDTTQNLASTPIINSGVFSINDVPIYVDRDADSWNDVIRKINNSGAGVTASYDAARDKFVIVSTDSTSRIKFGNATDTTNVLSMMGILRTMNVPQEIGDPGQNSIIKVNGQTYQRTTNQIDDVVEGMTISAATVGVTSVTVTVDTAKAVDTLAAFIKTYNEMVYRLKPEQISKKDREDKMEPLTEAEKESMEDEEIKEYMEEYDALHTIDITLKNSDVRALIQDFRHNIMATVEKNDSPFNSLADMGFEIAGAGDITITKMGLLMTTSTDLEEIKDAINRNSKIMDNLAKKPDEVYQFFGGYEEINETDSEYAARIAAGVDLSPKKVNVVVHDSWARRYERMITHYQDVEGRVGLKTRPDSALMKQMQRIDQEKDRISTRAEAYLERLWAQFTYMEQRIASIQSQADAVAKLGQTGGSSQ